MRQTLLQALQKILEVRNNHLFDYFILQKIGAITSKYKINGDLSVDSVVDQCFFNWYYSFVYFLIVTILFHLRLSK